MQSSRWGHLWSGLAGGLIAALVFTMIPATAANGDPILAGRGNLAGRATKLRSRGASTLTLTNTRGPGGVALELVTPAGVPPMQVNRTARVRRLNADLLDGRHANALIRGAYGTVDKAPARNGPVVTAAITAPRDGLLVISGSIDGSVNAGQFDFYTCGLAIDDAKVPGTSRTSFVQQPTTGGVNPSENCSTTGMHAVPAGAHTVSLDISGRDTAVFTEASVWALYVPFDGTGAVP
jgi:hypothetical protein